MKLSRWWRGWHSSHLIVQLLPFICLPWGELRVISPEVLQEEGVYEVQGCEFGLHAEGLGVQGVKQVKEGSEFGFGLGEQEEEVEGEGWVEKGQDWLDKVWTGAVIITVDLGNDKDMGRQVGSEGVEVWEDELEDLWLGFDCAKEGGPNFEEGWLNRKGATRANFLDVAA
jgi:hypothetical protein